MKNTYIQQKQITIPATTDTQIYQTLFKADDCYKYLSGVSLTKKVTATAPAPTFDIFDVELRDDYKSILSFSPFENWVKNSLSQSWNLQDLFKPIQLAARGRNFYINVKVKNLTANYSFTALLKQTTMPIPCARYDEQSFTVDNAYLGQGYQITLPSDYNTVKGIMFHGGDTTNDDVICLDIYDAQGQIVDPLPTSMLRVTTDTPYNNGFFPLDFESKSRQISVRLTSLNNSISYTPQPFTVVFLLVD